MRRLRPFLFCFVGLIASCQMPEHKAQIKSPLDQEIAAYLPPQTREQDWQKEAYLANEFAKDQDFYRAITGFKRARYLASTPEEKMHLSYPILLTYFFANRPQELLKEFETSPLKNADSNFKYFDSLLILLDQSYTQVGLEKKSQQLMKILEARSAEKARDYRCSKALMQADTEALQNMDCSIEDSLKDLVKNYDKQKLCVKRAGLYNALLPGAGYLYVGQEKSAFAAFCLNSLFIAAAHHFYQRGNTAAGIITTGFELGWYLGGIQGAMLSAQQYNAHLYQKKASLVLEQEKLYPIFFLERQF